MSEASQAALEALAEVRQVAAQLGRTPQAQELPSPIRARLLEHFRSYAQALDALGLPRPLRYDAWTRERVVERMGQLWADGHWISTSGLRSEQVLVNRTYHLCSSFDHGRALAGIPPLPGRPQVAAKALVSARRRFASGRADLDALTRELGVTSELCAMLLRGFAGDHEERLAQVPSDLSDEAIAVLRRRALECGDDVSPALLGKPFGLPAHHVRRVLHGAVREAAGTAARRRPAPVKSRIADLSDEAIRSLRERYARHDVQQSQLAAETGVSRAQMSLLLSGRARAEAGGPILSADERHARRWAVQAAAGPREPYEGERALAEERLTAMREAARARGGECLAEGYVRGADEVEWRCEEGHTFAASARTVLKDGRWCPTCAGRLSPEQRLAQMHEVARERGGRCLADRPVFVTEDVGWECAEGHRWRAPPRRVLSKGSWCPRCSPRSGPRS